MISKVAPKRQKGRGSFSDIRRYLEVGHADQAREDLIATWSGNVAGHHTADLEMERVASRGNTKDPVYHIILSWRPGEEIAEDILRASIDPTLRSLGAHNQQWFAAAHIDEDTQRYHLHLVVNKINPLDLKVHNQWREYYKLARSSEWIENAYGCVSDRHADWRKFLPELDLGISFEAFEARKEQALAHGLHVVPEGATLRENDAAHRAKYSWVSLLEHDLKPTIDAALQRSDATWSDLHAVVETYGVHLVRSGSGLRIVGGEVGQHVKASRLGLNFSQLENQLGPYQISTRAVTPLSEKLSTAREVCAHAKTWSELYDQLDAQQLSIKKRSLGGQLLDLQTGESIPLGRVGTTLPRLISRLGEFEEDQRIKERDQREETRKLIAIQERIAEVGKEPAMLLDRMKIFNAAWTRQDVAAEVARMVGTDVRELITIYKDDFHPLLKAVEAKAVVLGEIPIFRHGELTKNRDVLMTVQDIVSEEAQAIAEFERLIAQSRRLELRACSPDAGLSDEQKLGYDHLANGSSDFQLLTGIAGAGKSRLLRDVCAAYQETGYTVIGTAVAGDAARTLGEEAGISAVTVARLLIEIENGHRTLSDKTVIILDEATQLGTGDGLRLARVINAAGSRLLATGDFSQHSSVARGPIIEEMAQCMEVVDISQTRRAQHAWLREVGRDLREGRSGRALVSLRERGSIAEYETLQEAIQPLVEGYVRDIKAGRSALIVTTTRKAVAELNYRVREAMKDDLGERRDYQSAFGKRDFAIGDHVVTRRGIRNLSTTDGRHIHVVNGEQWKITEHQDNGKLRLERIEPDVAKHQTQKTLVDWDIAAHPEVDWAMATTSYRSQGRTVDKVYALMTPADAQRALYVDVTRARDGVLLSYSREEITDFGQVLDLGSRDRAKWTVHAAKRYVESVREELEKEQLSQERLWPFAQAQQSVRERNTGGREEQRTDKVRVRSAEGWKNVELDASTPSHELSQLAEAASAKAQEKMLDNTIVSTMDKSEQPLILRLTSLDEVPSWQTDDERRAFAKAVHKSGVGYLWVGKEKDQHLIFEFQNMEVLDRGNEIITTIDEPTAIRGALLIAREKGWNHVQLEGAAALQKIALEESQSVGIRVSPSIKSLQHELHVLSAVGKLSWQTDEERRQFMREVNTSKIGYMWQGKEKDQHIIFEFHQMDICDYGDKLVALSDNPTAVRGALLLAQAKGWDTVDLAGDEKLQLMAMSEAVGYSIAIESSSVTREQKEEYRREQLLEQAQEQEQDYGISR